MALSKDNLKIFPWFMFLSYFINFVISKFRMECLILFKPNSLHKFTFLYVVFSQTELFPYSSYTLSTSEKWVICEGFPQLQVHDRSHEYKYEFMI